MWWSILWLACTGAELTSTDDGPESPDDPSGDTADTASTLGPTEPVLPLIGEALGELCVTGSLPTPPGEGPLHRVTLDAPGMVCNDGSSPVAYIRAATDPDMAADWLVFLEGGRFCDSWQSCADRWCETPELMSGAGPLARSGSGVFRGVSPLGGGNQVFVQYCTSDLWGGRTEDARFTDGEPPFRMHMTGRTNVDGMLTLLEAGVTSDDDVEILPSLSDADRLFFGGGSAGAWGALQALDEVAARLEGVQVIGLIDGLQSPLESDLPAHVLEPYQESRTDQFTRMDALVALDLHDGCEAATPVESRRLCASVPELQLDFVQTPMVITADLGDPVAGASVLAAGATPFELAAANEASLRQIAQARPESGVWSAACGQHTILRSDLFFGIVTVVDAGADGPEYTASETLAAYMGGEALVVVPGPSGAGVDCP